MGLWTPANTFNFQQRHYRTELFVCFEWSIFDCSIFQTVFDIDRFWHGLAFFGTFCDCARDLPTCWLLWRSMRRVSLPTHTRTARSCGPTTWARCILIAMHTVRSLGHRRITRCHKVCNEGASHLRMVTAAWNAATGPSPGASGAAWGWASRASRDGRLWLWLLQFLRRRHFRHATWYAQVGPPKVTNKKHQDREKIDKVKVHILEDIVVVKYYTLPSSDHCDSSDKHTWRGRGNLELGQPRKFRQGVQS